MIGWSVDRALRADGVITVARYLYCCERRNIAQRMLTLRLAKYAHWYIELRDLSHCSCTECIADLVQDGTLS